MEKEDRGQLILQGLSDTRRFFEQVSLLIRTLEESLKEQGWEPVSTSNQSCEITSHLSKPKKWMPRWVSRFFINEEHKDLLLYVGVLLDEPLDEAGTWAGYREPWVTCGLFQYMTGKTPDSSWKLDWVTTHLYFKKDPDGKFQLRQYSHDETAGEGILREMTMALPLIAVTSAEDAKCKIIDPLIKAVESTLT